jgi:hypothetical protein
MFLLLALTIVADRIRRSQIVLPIWIWPPVAALLSCAIVRSLNPVSAHFLRPAITGDELRSGGVVKSAFWIVGTLEGVPVSAVGCAAIAA